MLIGRIGNVRTGKTLLGVKFLTNLANIPENKDKGFYGGANFPVYDKRIKSPLTVDDFINLELDELNSGLVSLQEFWSWLYNRLSGSEISRGINPIVLQSGKRGFDIDWDAQLASSLDLTVRRLTEKFWVTRNTTKIWPKKYHYEIIAFNYVYSTSRILLRYRMPTVMKSKQGQEIPVAKRYFDLYDTRYQSDLQYQKKDNHDNAQQPQGVKQKVQQFTSNEKKELNIEQGFNTEPPKTLISANYGKEIPLEPKNLEQIIASGQVKTMSLDEPYLADSHDKPVTIIEPTIHQTQKDLAVIPKGDIALSSYSNDELKQSGVLEPILDERLKPFIKIRDLEDEIGNAISE